MSRRMSSELYRNDISNCANLPVDWKQLNGKTIAVSGATGMIGTFLIDVLMYKNDEADFQCDVIAIGRSALRAKERFPYFNDEHFHFEQLDVSVPDAHPSDSADVVFHLASSTHPKAYALEPIKTITSNVIGLENLLKYSLHSSDLQKKRLSRVTIILSLLHLWKFMGKIVVMWNALTNVIVGI